MENNKFSIIEKYNEDTYLCESNNIIAFFIKTQLTDKIYQKNRNINERLRYELSQNYTIIDVSTELDFCWNVLKYQYTSDEYKMLFRNFCSDLSNFLLYNKRSNKKFANIIETHSHIFATKTRDLKKLLGKFGELFLIYKIFLMTNGRIDLSLIYQIKGYEPFDFKKDQFELDVKTKTSASNTIYLTKNQIIKTPNIALVTLYESQDGYTINSLIDKMIEMDLQFIHINLDEIKKEYSIYDQKYDLELSNIKFISKKDIPDFSNIINHKSIIDISIMIELDPIRLYSIDKLVDLLGGVL